MIEGIYSATAVLIHLRICAHKKNPSHGVYEGFNSSGLSTVAKRRDL